MESARAELGYFRRPTKRWRGSRIGSPWLWTRTFGCRPWSSRSVLVEGARKHQSPALADQMQTVISENSTNRDQLRQYMQDLAAQKEQEFKIADSEAQRCRGAWSSRLPHRAKQPGP